MNVHQTHVKTEELVMTGLTRTHVHADLDGRDKIAIEVHLCPLCSFDRQSNCLNRYLLIISINTKTWSCIV